MTARYTFTAPEGAFEVGMEVELTEPSKPWEPPHVGRVVFAEGGQYELEGEGMARLAARTALSIACFGKAPGR